MLTRCPRNSKAGPRNDLAVQCYFTIHPLISFDFAAEQVEHYASWIFETNTSGDSVIKDNNLDKEIKVKKMTQKFELDTSRPAEE